MAVRFSKSASELLAQPSQFLDTRQLLRRLIDSKNSAVSAFLNPYRSQLERDWAELEWLPDGAGRVVQYFGRLVNLAPVSEEVIQALAKAKELAVSVGSTSVDTHHILAGLQDQVESQSSIFLSKSIDSKALLESIAAMGDIEFEEEVLRTCSGCGLQTPITAVFADKLCLKCQPSSTSFIGLTVLMGLILLAFGLVFTDQILTMVGGNILLLILCRAVSSVVHEFGHFVAAKFVSNDVALVVIGRSGREQVFRAFGTFWLVRSTPIGGFCYTSPTSLVGYRWKQSWVYAGGPLANLLIAGLAFPGLEDPELVTKEFTPFLLLAATNLWVAVANLIPDFGLLPNGSAFLNDGKAILNIWNGNIPKWTTDVTHRATWTAQALHKESLHSYVPKALEGFLQEEPDNPTLLMLTLSEPADFKTLIDDPRLSELRKNLLGSVAWLHILEGDLQRAAALIDEALTLSPRSSVARAGDAALKLLSGKHEEGVVQLRFWTRDPSLVSKAAIVNVLAYGERLLGNQERADQTQAVVERLSAGIEPFEPSETAESASG